MASGKGLMAGILGDARGSFVIVDGSMQLDFKLFQAMQEMNVRDSNGEVVAKVSDVVILEHGVKLIIEPIDPNYFKNLEEGGLTRDKSFSIEALGTEMSLSAFEEREAMARRALGINALGQTFADLYGMHKSCVRELIEEANAEPKPSKSNPMADFVRGSQKGGRKRHW